MKQSNALFAVASHFCEPQQQSTTSRVSLIGMARMRT
jgi:hypothetical protein